ncbi:MAG: DUF115 domain-containing protein [Spirochaeta sp.]|nr:DUF115 domain-containing protein [Spirochaeta sp.]
MSSDIPLLKDTGRGFTIFYKGKHLYSPRKPYESAVDRVKRLSVPSDITGQEKYKTLLAEKSLIFIPAIGLAYGFKELLEILPAESHILCIEADQQLMALAFAQKAAVIPSDPRLTIVRTTDPAGAVKTLRDIGTDKFRRLIPLYLSGGFHLYRETYNNMQKSLEDEIRRFWQNKMTLINMADLWIKNLFENLLSLPEARDIGTLKTAKAILVIGAGPSLEKNIALLRDYRAGFILIAVDTVLPILLAQEIVPDYVFALEAQIANLQDFIPYAGDSISGIPLICDITSNPAVVRLFSPNVFFFSSHFFPLRLFRRLQENELLPTPFPALGSVGVAAVYAALNITSGPVLVAGLDFSFPCHKTHARGSPANLAMLHRADRLTPVGLTSYEQVLSRPLLKLKGKGGGVVVTDLVLQSYSVQLKEHLGNLNRAYDLGRQGLPLGARLIKNEKELAEILKEPCKENGQTGKDKLSAIKAFPASRIDHLLRGEIHRLEPVIEEIRAHLNHADVEDSREQENIMLLLEELDYLYLHFPELKMESNRPYLLRVLHSAATCHKRLTNLLSRMPCNQGRTAGV